jgi:hypothetical protein
MENEEAITVAYGSNDYYGGVYQRLRSERK